MQSMYSLDVEFEKKKIATKSPKIVDGSKIQIEFIAPLKHSWLISFCEK